MSTPNVKLRPQHLITREEALMGVYYIVVCHEKKEYIDPAWIASDENPKGYCIKQGCVLYGPLMNIVANWAMTGGWSKGHVTMTGNHQHAWITLVPGMQWCARCGTTFSEPNSYNSPSLQGDSQARGHYEFCIVGDYSDEYDCEGYQDVSVDAIKHWMEDGGKISPKTNIHHIPIKDGPGYDEEKCKTRPTNQYCESCTAKVGEVCHT